MDAAKNCDNLVRDELFTQIETKMKEGKDLHGWSKSKNGK